jgi:chitodextrinase
MPAFASPPPYRPTRQTWRNAFYYQPVDALPAHGSSAAYISAMQASNAADPNIRMVPFGQDNWNAGSESYYFVDSWPSNRPVSRANWSIINTNGSTANPHLYWPDLRQQNAVRNSPWAQALFGLPDYAVNLSNGDRHAILWSESTGELVEAIGYSGLGAAAEAIVTWDLDSYVLPRNGSTPVGAVAACFPVAPLMFTYQDLLDCGASGDLGHMLGLSVFNYGTTFGWPARKSDGTLAGGVPGGTVFRLKSNFNLNSLPNNALKAVARTLQRFGAVIYDRNFTRHQILTPNDPAWPQGQSDLGVLLGSLFPWSAFEAVNLSSVAGVTDSIAVSGSTPAVQGVTLDGDPASVGVSLNVSARLTVSATAAEPVARFTATPTTGMVPLTVTFDGGSSRAADGGPVSSWSWDFGDGTTASGRVVTHTYLTPGEYTPDLTVTAGDSVAPVAAYERIFTDWDPTAPLLGSDPSQSLGGIWSYQNDYPSSGVTTVRQLADGVSAPSAIATFTNKYMRGRVATDGNDWAAPYVVWDPVNAEYNAAGVIIDGTVYATPPPGLAGFGGSPVDQLYWERDSSTGPHVMLLSSMRGYTRGLLSRFNVSTGSWYSEEYLAPVGGNAPAWYPYIASVLVSNGYAWALMTQGPNNPWLVKIDLDSMAPVGVWSLAVGAPLFRYKMIWKSGYFNNATNNSVLIAKVGSKTILEFDLSVPFDTNDAANDHAVLGTLSPVSQITLPDGFATRDMVVDNNLLWVSSDASGVRVFDLDTDALVGSVDELGSADPAGPFTDPETTYFVEGFRPSGTQYRPPQMWVAAQGHLVQLAVGQDTSVSDSASETVTVGEFAPQPFATTRFTEAIRYSHRAITRAELITPLGDRFMLPVVDGTLTIDRRNQVWRTADLTVGLDAVGTIERAAIERLNVVGSDIALYAGIFYENDNTELVQIARLRVETFERRLSAASIQIAARDYASMLEEYPITPDYNTKLRGQDLVSAVSLLVNDALPYVMPGMATRLTVGDGLPAWQVPTDATFDGDGRLDTIVRWCEAAGVYFFNLPNGTFYLRAKDDVDSSVLTVSDGDGGVLIDANEAFSRLELYNAVEVAFDAPEGVTTPVRAFVVDDDPASPTYWDGPFGKRVKQVSNVPAKNNAEASAAAIAKLNEAKGISRGLRVTGLRYPTLIPGDSIVVELPNEASEQHVVEAVTHNLSGATVEIETRFVS